LERKSVNSRYFVGNEIIHTSLTSEHFEKLQPACERCRNVLPIRLWGFSSAEMAYNMSGRIPTIKADPYNHRYSAETAKVKIYPVPWGPLPATLQYFFTRRVNYRKIMIPSSLCGNSWS
jgi:hypothetical protein